MSDIFTMPAFLSYPIIPDLKGRPEVHGLFCYVLREYQPGKSILVARKDNTVGVRVGDWNGNMFTKDDGVGSLLLSVDKIIKIMKVVNFPQAQYFFSADGRLVDAQLSLNKFMGPGMLRDLFSKQFELQEEIEKAVLAAEKINEIRSNKSKYGDRVIVKPSRYRFVTTNHSTGSPLYASIG